MTAVGHEDQFPPTSLSVRSRISQATVTPAFCCAWWASAEEGFRSSTRDEATKPMSWIRSKQDRSISLDARYLPRCWLRSRLWRKLRRPIPIEHLRRRAVAARRLYSNMPIRKGDRFAPSALEVHGKSCKVWQWLKNQNLISPPNFIAL